MPMHKRPIITDEDYWSPKYVRMASGPGNNLASGSDRVLRSSTKRNFTPSVEEQTEAKQLCLAAVMEFCAPTMVLSLQ